MIAHRSRYAHKAVAIFFDLIILNLLKRLFQFYHLFYFTCHFAISRYRKKIVIVSSSTVKYL